MRDVGYAGVIGIIDQGAVDILFGFVAGAAAYKQAFLFADLLCAGQGLEGGGNIAIGAGRGSYI